MKRLCAQFLFSFILFVLPSCGTGTDGDGEPDPTDQCPTDPGKLVPGECGCNIAEGTCSNDADADGDGTPDTEDKCPIDPNKTVPGQCGCGIAETDGDGDHTADCIDNCPSDADKIDPGECGCGISEGTCSDSNLKPVVSFIQPTGGTVSKDLGVVVEANDPDGHVAKVDLYINNSLVRIETDSPYTWGTANSTHQDDKIIGLSPGNYKLRAVATDDKGASASDEIAITITVEDQARWTFLFFINGDNNLEEWVVPELNYLEEVGSGDGVHIVVQADRIPGYSTDDGDWTETRRYYITADSDTQKVSSTVVENLGELDMGAPETLSDFLLWARQEYPAERTVLVFWDHGDSWRGDQASPPPTARTVSDDETSQSSLSIAEGEVNEGLAASVQHSGPIELIVFDACYMASWEVAHSLQGYARYMAASEATMGAVGLYYVEAIRMVRDDPGVDAAALADSMAATSVQHGEQTYSALEIDALGEVSSAVDQLARAVLADDNLVQPLLQARNNAHGADQTWEEWYLDLNDLGAQLRASDDTRLHSHGEAIQSGIDAAVIGAYGNSPYEWAGGLTIMFDTSDKQSLQRYANGAGATWSQDTKWGDLLLYLADQ